MVQVRVSPGVGPAGPVSVATTTDFWVATDRAVIVSSGPAGSATALSVPAGSRGSSGVQLPTADASLLTVVAAPPVGSMTGFPAASSSGTQNPTS